MELIKIIEALLFSYQEPLSVELMGRAVRETAKEIVEAGEGEEVTAAAPLANVSDEQVAQTLQELIAGYEREGRAFTVAERGTGWRLCARTEYAEWCRSLYPGKKPQRLSQPALETLAIIAYRQPITRPQIESIRGVDSSGVIVSLLERNLIAPVGKLEAPGRPTLFGITQEFLSHFGLKDVKELPVVEP